jgi:hypothetical protein
MVSPDRGINHLPAPDYSVEEREKIVQYLMNFKGDLIRAFLDNKPGFLKSGNKPELKERIIQYLDEGRLEYSDLVNYVDTIVPYEKQHDILFNGPKKIIDNWRKTEYVAALLKKHNIDKYLNAKLPLILPEQLTLSSVEYNEANSLVVYAVNRHEYLEREEEHDEHKNIDDKEIILRAYSQQIGRGAIIFSWDLISNSALLKILQLESNYKYEEVEEQFSELMKPWLDLTLFEKVNLSSVIKKLHEAEEKGIPETRSHGIGYKTPGGRSITANSPGSHYSVLGEPILDKALKRVRSQFTGNLGNFYWLPKLVTPKNHNILDKELHSIIVASKNRINFTTPNSKEDMEYVLSRVRSLS